MGCCDWLLGPQCSSEEAPDRCKNQREVLCNGTINVLSLSSKNRNPTLYRDGWNVSSLSCCTKIKPKYPLFWPRHLALLTSFGNSLCRIWIYIIISKFTEHLDKHQSDTNYLNYVILRIFWLFRLVHLPSANVEEAGFITYTAASQQRAIQMIWLHCWGSVSWSILTYSLVQRESCFLLFK